ncbi:hypothetical protein JR316_0003120 [Psilocybe cubensis]|uniref:Uncharacterized protein n=2 Tax=Psilocybe cubensis TaxID=181762 RepID=A0ACB8H912_PSICU|nr:hypothetical protein JR316_0003120 [Psilocybe cubensis]KAH9483650.1 hypothetical protein JR316_0003120 [Psilocybe cubensis]
MASVGKWAPGASYGPVLSQTDLYLLNSGQNTELELNPIIEGKLDKVPLQFNLISGYSGSMVTNPNGEAVMQGRDEPATLPRVSQLIVISRHSPWCTIVKKETGVTIGDLCSALFKEYTENYVTDAELSTVPARVQDHMKRTAANNFVSAQSNQVPAGWGYSYPPANLPDKIRRVDWLRERVYVDRFDRDDGYARSRLGFKAPNVLVMDLTG